MTDDLSVRPEDPVQRRALAAVIACLHLLDRDWDRLSDVDRRSGVALALEAIRRAVSRPHHP